jgi:acyl transferase domain-containing protein/acyl-CoA thioesterase FadM
VPYFATPFRVLFHDSMAYGTHHFLTNFKFQCEAREQFFFGEVIEHTPEAKAAFDEIVLLTQQAYSRSLAPVAVGETVGILMSYEDPTLSSLRFCFRVIRRDGTPVACGFQTIVCLSQKTQELVSPPAALLRYQPLLLERLESPSFSERVLAGQMRAIFDEESIALGKAVAAEPNGGHRFVGMPRLKLERGCVLLLPGQGSYHPALFAQLREIDPEVGSLIRRVDEIARSWLGTPFAELGNATGAGEQAEVLERHPDLAQLAAYLASIVVGRRLLDAGLRPDLVVGHSAGELAALALGGAYTVETGAEVVCRRLAALAPLADIGGMVALGCDARRATGLVDALGAGTLELAVLNHSSQTVVSGAHGDLGRLEQLSAHLGISCQRVQSRYPFHSRLLNPAVDRFAASLGDLKVRAPAIPVYSAVERSLYTEGARLSSLLPSHFVRQLDFRSAMDELYAAGARDFVECGGGDILTRMSRRILDGRPDIRAFSTLPAGKPARPILGEVLEAFRIAPAASAAITADDTLSSRRSAPSPPGEGAIAIVGLGCVLPGANDPESLWRNVLHGTSGLRDGAELEPEYARAFLSPGDVVPDKTYTLLGGLIDRAATDELPAEVREIAGASSSARLLAVATAQCLAGMARRPDARRTQFLVGSTADGTLEHDEILLIEGLLSLSSSLEQPAAAVAGLQRALRRVFSHSPESAWRLAPYPSIRAVAEALLGDGVKAVAVDAACASSLYAIGLAMQALRDGECDVAFAGGTFAPGPANSCLFSQFHGLSATGSRPFDAGADGVVFCSGAAMAVCKRLPDALRDGDRVLALIRGMGASSDGKSSSVAEPKKSGQVLAMRRAYAAAGIDPASVQYVEAHATSTPVGDAVELNALAEVFSARAAGAPPIALGSVKALIGHTGWAAGAASLVKVCRALGEKQLPPQAHFDAPNPDVDLARSPFAVLAAPQAWPRGAEARRAGINGFGFGGTNAHLIVEEFDPEIGVASIQASPSPASPSALAVVGVGALFPWGGDARRLCFSPDEIRLPAGKPVLPEVQEHMDRAQFLALTAAEKALGDLGDRWREMRDDIAVVLGVEGKTARSLAATQRIYVDFVRARLARLRFEPAFSDPELLDCEEALAAAARSAPPSNPYSLPGLMPNVVAGRVAHFFDLHGPNLVVDAGPSSLLEALLVAERMLRRGECKVALAGGIAGNARPEAALMVRPHAEGRPVAEAALVLALVPLERARAERMPIRAVLSFAAADGSARAGEAAPAYLLGAEGAWEVASAIARGGVSSVEWPRAGGRLRSASFAPAAEEAAAATESAAHGPIRLTAPRLERIAPCRAQPSPRSAKRALVLVDRPPLPGLLPGIDPTLLCPAGAPVPGAIPIDLTSDDTVAASLRQLDGREVDLVVALADLSSAGADRVLTEGATGRGLLELLLVAARWSYPSLQAGRSAVAALTVGAWRGDELDPYTGLFGGFLKSLARELPGCTCKAVHSGDDSAAALAQLEAELGEGAAGPVEVAYRRGDRYTQRLVPVSAATRAPAPLLGRESVVVATGGARGVTAVLVETAIERSGCRVVLLGRTDPEALPPQLRALDEASFAAREPAFYAEEVARSPGTKIPEMRKRWEQYRAAREVLTTLARLRARGGRVDYLCVDITDGTAVDDAVREIAREHGCIDLVLHGAGTQASCVLPRKKIHEFRRVVATKLGGLAHLRAACARHLPGQPILFHLLTSAFSFFGNDGQPDYGAANQAMDRLVLHQAAAGGGSAPWTSMAWLGWAEVGMTRGSEYAALARVRGLRPVLREEGKALFASFLDGPAAAPVHVMISDGELRFYGVELSSGDTPAASAAALPCATWKLSVSSHPFLCDHRVRGVPTMPGTFELELAVRAARAFRPSLCVVSIEHAMFDRFVQVHDGAEVELRARLRLVEEDAHAALVKVSLHSDFIHKSGRVLQRDIRHFSASVRLADRPCALPAATVGTNGARGVPAIDPYLAAGSPVKLDGLFRCLEEVRLHADHRTASFHISAPESLPQIAAFLTPSLLLDAMTRCAVIAVEDDGAMPIWVPVSAGRTLLPQGVNDASLHAAGGGVRIQAVAPRFAGDLVYADHVEAIDAEERAFLVVEGLVARRAGQVYVE